ncbi:hypothetical protein Tcan_10427 [Toxocara canis]|uniref:Uncharacterized protein n=1 Tax=Toxocara canis TaxID=6265 RepID=A0A0B2V192_TOXCA|nr:hypothetical protein Tcan_10427 [Toxocara canis]
MKAAMDDDKHDECDSEQDPADLISTSIDQPFQRINDDCESVMTSSQTLCHSPRVRPNRSILKKNKEVVSCDVKARSCRSKSVTFCVPDDTPRKRKERNPILKVLEAFDRKFSQECEISPSRQKLNVFERKRDDSNGSPNNC